MFSFSSILLIVLAYSALMFAVAQWTEHRRFKNSRFALGPYVYALSITAYTTSWTFYGSVGSASRSGFLFLGYYLGPTLAFVFAGSILKKMIRLKQAHQFTSLADFISTRYDKSQTLAAITTVVAVLSTVPYLALQLKSLVVSTSIMTGHSAFDAYLDVGETLAPIVALFLLVFTILFGMRRLTPTERHPGIIITLAFASILKLGAFLLAGIFICYFIYDGIDDIFGHLSEFRNAFNPDRTHNSALPSRTNDIITWLTHLVLSSSAVFFLPRQFLLSVIENSDERHLRSASWIFPLYLLVITIFVIPIAGAGMVLGFDSSQGDHFVLTLPVLFGNRWLALAVFMGGIAAGTGMIVIAIMAIATMVSNHWLLPVINLAGFLKPLRRRVLWMRWVTAALLLGAAFLFERLFGPEDNLANIGLISFAGILQFAPAAIAALYWNKANRTGALLALTGGSLVWFYTLILPDMTKINWLPLSFMVDGPFGISALRPQALLGLSFLPPLSHSVFWSLLVNITGLIFGSIAFRQSSEEQRIAHEFVNILEPAVHRPAHSSQTSTIPLSVKISQVGNLFASFFDPGQTKTLMQQVLLNAGLQGRENIDLLELVELQHESEKVLASIIGTPAAHSALKKEKLMSPDESRQLAAAYADLFAELMVSPSELKERVDYHQQRSQLLEHEAQSARILARASQQMFATLDVKNTLQSIGASPLPELAEASLIFLPQGYSLGENSDALAFFRHSDEETALTRTIAKNIQDTLDQDPQICARLTIIKKILLSQKPRSSPDDAPEDWTPLFASFPFHSSYCTPLKARGSLLGILVLFSASPGRYQEIASSQLIEQLVDRAANALDNAMLFASAQKALQDREDFLSIASHELRTPLTGLRTQVQLLARLATRNQLASYPMDKLSTLLDGSDRHIERLGRLISELLDLARARSGTLHLNLEEFDLGLLLTEAMERLRNEINALKCEVVLDLQNGVIGTWDRVKLEEVVVNLLTNALKYAPGKPIEMRVWKEQDKVLFSVHDHGQGIPKHEQSRIFMRFKRAHRNTEVSGFGLGLYIAQQIILAHGGSIWVKSELGQGAVFTVELPLISEQPSPKEKQPVDSGDYCP
ncbi:MAG TPA: hypothetical protein DCS07_03200 [Bdellovibrionales bacterium]|nr:MAG: hypothetical protein A2Z97_07005 [Bdellovibrionales bacterium GWB1_52_6]OFZ05445.1 MAG: hypothetical protein A2X97_11245 [Bdellovibrionales bacterium GWA1_52_35]HAR41629.1 hypothetical protein [Bdellovibrionales bacterium]HCM39190.1 hypothetical protein [Bdellovibrionales bacterium]